MGTEPMPRLRRAAIIVMTASADRAERTLAEFIAVKRCFPASLQPAVDVLAESPPLLHHRRRLPAIRRG